jgi:hypothetical protein
MVFIPLAIPSYFNPILLKTYYVQDAMLCADDGDVAM